ncbi:MAG: thioredoxin domain-containing protein [Deltaproteobacteria bacterium]|nr:thioredoxin domain-containing protein [Deltaproteobacteria bacterium]
MEKFPKEVKLVYKNFPLPNQRFAVKAAQCALAANEQGKFWEFHEKLFQVEKGLNNEKINGIAGGLALDMEKFAKDMNSPAIRDILSRDFNDGRRIGLRGIPTILINGKIAERRGLADLQAIVEEEIKASF